MHQGIVPIIYFDSRPAQSFYPDSFSTSPAKLSALRIVFVSSSIGILRGTERLAFAGGSPAKEESCITWQPSARDL